MSQGVNSELRSVCGSIVMNDSGSVAATLAERIGDHTEEGRLWFQDRDAWIALVVVKHHTDREVKMYHWSRMTREQKAAINRALGRESKE